MKKMSFTLMEVLLSMAIIGVIAGATANSIKNVSANKVKTSFQNNYTHMQRTIDTILSDETIIPAIYNYNTTTGKQERASMCSSLFYSLGNTTGNSTLDWIIFPRTFRDLTSGIISQSILDTGAVSGGVTFTTKNGSYWVVRWNPDNTTCQSVDTNDIKNTDFLIIFDIDGINKGTNCPYTGSELRTAVANCTNPDTFKFGTTVSNKILPDTSTVYNGLNLQTYMDRNNLIKTKF